MAGSVVQTSLVPTQAAANRGVGPPHGGLRPGFGRYPGHNPAYDNPGPRRTIQYPGITSSRYPGRSAYIFVATRRALYPATTLFPGANPALIPGGPRERRQPSVYLISRGSFSLIVARGYTRTAELRGTGALYVNPLGSSAARTRLSAEVYLGKRNDLVELAPSSATIELASSSRVIRL